MEIWRKFGEESEQKIEEIVRGVAESSECKNQSFNFTQAGSVG